jgi:hypothetical protein
MSSKQHSPKICQNQYPKHFPASKFTQHKTSILRLKDEIK